MINVVQLYEFDTLYLSQMYEKLGGGFIKFEKRHFDALLKYNDLHGGKYFVLVFEGVRFKSYVGVIQVDDLVIEVLPKIERVNGPVNWRDVLVEMLRETSHLRISQIGNAIVDKQDIHLLDIYFDLFLSEVETLLRKGLVKKYYTETKNTLSLKGKLEFAGNIRKNIVHKERFYTTHQVYSGDHLFHQIIHQALCIVGKLSRTTYRFGRCQSLQLNFPEVSNIVADFHTFSRLSYSGKTDCYRTAIEIARLIILNYAPNIKSGSENMLALLFNMNDLWEGYVLTKLQQATKEFKVYGQQGKTFWKGKTMRPDIVLIRKVGDMDETFIIDTKWKNYRFDSISSNDLRQIYVYSDYWSAVGGMLLYPNAICENKIVVEAPFEGGKGFIGKMGLVSVLNINGGLNRDLGKDILMLLEK
jgi:5-methylcytosine-specific restriction enzyme subunit McrC